MNEGERTIRCPRLGHEVPFTYCQRESAPFPCALIISCWERLLPVEQILRRDMDEETWQAYVNRLPQHKISALVDLITQARERRGKR